MLVVLVGLLYEKLGQQHNNLLATYRIFIVAHATLCCVIHVCCALGSAGANVHSRLNVWACAKTMQSSSPLFQSSPVQSSDCMPPDKIGMAL